MDLTEKFNIFDFLAGAAIGAMITLFAIVLAVECKFVHKRRIVDAGYAYYHPTTGEFTWKAKGGE